MWVLKPRNGRKYGPSSVISSSSLSLLFLPLLPYLRNSPSPPLTDDRTINTEDCLTYNFEPIYGDTFNFSVACSNDAHLALTSGAEETTPMYEIFIGGWENQNSAIRLNKGEWLGASGWGQVAGSE